MMGARRIALAGLLALLVLVAGEGIATLLEPQSAFRSLHTIRPDRPWLYDLTPGSSATTPMDGVEYRIAEHGFRDRPRRMDKPTGIFRIAILGDSITFGFGVPVEETFVALLEQRLGLQAHPEVEVLNFGVSGFNPYNEAELFRGVVREYDPDLTLVQFCINDLNDPRHHFGASTIQRLGALPPEAFPNAERAAANPWKVSGFAALCDRSSLCRTLLGGRIGPSRQPGDRDEVLETFEVRTSARYETEWAWLRERYAEIADAAAEIGSEFGIIVFPSAADIDPDREHEGAAISLVRIGTEERWEVIDLTPALQHSGLSRQDLFMDLWHPTPRGHRIAADGLAGELRKRRLLEALDQPQS
jgi:hypothetical protein